MGVSRGKSIPNKLVLGERIIHSKPPFTINQIKKAIPLHCFQRSLLRSFSYAIFDLIFASALYYIANIYFPLLQHPSQYFAWPIYWLSQGSIFTAISTIGHECGHRGFSDYQLVDDIVGFIFHTFLLVPYFSFKFTHRRHHSNTASLERDELCLPKPKHELRWYFKYLTNPPARLLIILATITLGWPLYLTFNISGRFHDSFASHYVPNSPLFHEKERLQVHISNVGILGMCYLLYKMAIAKGMIWVIRIYGVPILVMNGFLVLITSLQHTHPSFPYYDSSEWEWLRGNLVTVDRDYGMVLNKVFHNLTNTHVVHHLFPSLPHYHAIEATKAVMPILGEYYQFDDTPILKALWREFRECVYVEPDHKDDSSKGVFWFHNKL